MITAAIVLNIIFAAIVIVAVVTPLARAIRTSAAATPTATPTPAAARSQRERARRRSGGLVAARPWA